MKTLAKTLMLSGFVALTVSSAAVAGDYPLSQKEKRAVSNMEYWSKKDSAKPADKNIRLSSSAQASNVSEYPCGRCVYSHELNGYVEKTTRK